ncbi:MAG: spermidine synthase [Tractidigestivibacter sp.]|jgi:spermidine synthase|uniref:spermidine synthase n=1 Tax=Tractidigestivibacter sp. TaxID=2847320 RepID=UPI003D8B226E
MAREADGYRPTIAERLPHVACTASGPAFIHTIRRGAVWQRVLSVGGVWQSATLFGPRRMEPAFAYYRAFARGFDLVPDAQRLLVIGGGGFAFPKLVAAERPSVTTDAVEIDPAVIDIARRWFYLDEACELQRVGGGALNVICDDGRAVLDAAAPESYDIVVLDAFVGAEPVRSLATREAAVSARQALSARGVLLANVAPGPGESFGFLQSTVATLRGPFRSVAITQVEDERSDGENYIVLASGAPLCLPDAIPYGTDFLGEVLHDEK